MTIVYIILIIVAIYLFAGLVFAIPFVIKGVTQIDEGAIGSKWGFRVIIIPGVIVFWPVLLKKWREEISRKSTREQ
ncbi:hypothetical protein [Terrimonas alba]|uniref:hypothetical protein n=1 Tax=Terrimonas alba TaxID=3349636 RepID=UPI0035F29030